MALFDAPTGAQTQTQLVSGSPAYQQAIVDQTQKRLQPAYAHALRQTQQDFSGRGLLDSGLGAQAELGLQQGYLNQLGDVSNQAAIHGADLAEQNRQREETRGWQVADKNQQMDYAREQADNAASAAANKQWADLIGGTAGAIGTVYGGPLVGAAAQQGASGLVTNMQSKPKPGNPYGVSGVQPAGYSYNSSNPYGL